MASRFVLPFADVGSGISPSDGAKLEFFVSGTSTQKDTFSDEALTTKNANPVIANGSGVFPAIFLPDGGRYKVTLDDKNIVQKFEADPVVGVVSAGITAKTFDTVALMIASTELNIGDIVETAGYTTKGDGGDNRYEVVAAATSTVDGGSFIDLTGITGQAKGLFPKDIVNVKQFGAVGDNVSDDTTEIQAAITFNNGTTEVPPGSYKVTALTISLPDQTLSGSTYASKILSSDNTSDVITITAAANSTRLTGLTFSTSDGGKRTGGKFIKSSAFRTLIDNFIMFNGFDGILYDTNSICTIDQGEFRNFGPSGDCIEIDTPGADVSINEIVMDHPAGAQPATGILVTSVQDVTISNCNLIHCGDDLKLAPPTGKTTASVWATNTFFDTAVRGVSINPTGGNVIRVRFDSCWFSSHTNQGVAIDSSGGGLIDGVTFIDPHCHLNTSNGFQIFTGGNTKNINVIGGAMAQNGGSGIAVGVGSTDFFFRDVRAGAIDGLTGNTGSGIFVDTGCTNFEISDSRFVGNTVSGYNGGSFGATGAVVKGNTGFKTVGQGSGIITSAATSVTVSHGLAVTPLITEINVTPTSALQSATEFWITTVTATTFDINVDIAPGSSISFGFNVNSDIRGF